MALFSILLILLAAGPLQAARTQTQNNGTTGPAVVITQILYDASLGGSIRDELTSWIHLPEVGRTAYVQVINTTEITRRPLQLTLLSPQQYADSARPPFNINNVLPAGGWWNQPNTDKSAAGYRWSPVDGAGPWGACSGFHTKATAERIMYNASYPCSPDDAIVNAATGRPFYNMGATLTGNGTAGAISNDFIDQGYIPVPEDGLVYWIVRGNPSFQNGGPANGSLNLTGMTMYWRIDALMPPPPALRPPPNPPSPGAAQWGAAPRQAIAVLAAALASLAVLPLLAGGL